MADELETFTPGPQDYVLGSHWRGDAFVPARFKFGQVEPGPVQIVAYAATITPDAALGPIVLVGALTGGLTVAAPLNPAKGAVLQFVLTQDGTGGRAVVWNAVFKTGYADAGNTANKVAVITFLCVDGINWRQTCLTQWAT